MNCGVDDYGSLSGLCGVKIMEDFGLLGAQRSKPIIIEVYVGKSERANQVMSFRVI